ncbi:hypothetical protein HK104_002080 [Borealophlyctis nickersoniae]|nr:hypothetical protein HK104_002080 [Borealophlyctis nickersoniae]
MSGTKAAPPVARSWPLLLLDDSDFDHHPSLHRPRATSEPSLRSSATPHPSHPKTTNKANDPDRSPTISPASSRSGDDSSGDEEDTAGRGLHRRTASFRKLEAELKVAYKEVQAMFGGSVGVNRPPSAPAFHQSEGGGVDTGKVQKGGKKKVKKAEKGGKKRPVSAQRAKVAEAERFADALPSRVVAASRPQSAKGAVSRPQSAKGTVSRPQSAKSEASRPVSARVGPSRPTSGRRVSSTVSVSAVAAEQPGLDVFDHEAATRVLALDAYDVATGPVFVGEQGTMKMLSEQQKRGGGSVPALWRDGSLPPSRPTSAKCSARNVEMHGSGTVKKTSRPGTALSRTSTYVKNQHVIVNWV